MTFILPLRKIQRTLFQRVTMQSKRNKITRNLYFRKDERFICKHTKFKSGIASRCGVRSRRSCIIFHCFTGGWVRVFDFSEKAKRDINFRSNFEKGSLKGSFRKKKRNYEILQISADSRYLWSVAINFSHNWDIHRNL